jgi:cell division septation protein DedD
VEPAPEELQAAPEAAEEAKTGRDLQAEDEVRQARAQRRTKTYVVQVGAFSSLKNADDLTVKLKKKGYPSYVRISSFKNKKTLYFVLIGRYGDRQMAKDTMQQLKADAINSFIKAIKD